MNNPQYRIVVHSNSKDVSNRRKLQSGEKHPIKFTVEGDRDLPLGIAVTWGKGERVHEYDNLDFMFHYVVYILMYISV